MKILKYITIEPQDSFDEAVSKINRQINKNQFVSREAPATLTGNQKILKLVAKKDSTAFIKIDGPGFIIDELFNYFEGN